MITSKSAQFNKELEKIKNLDFQEVRADSNGYFEAVLLKNKLVDLTKNLENIFGALNRPSEKELPGQIQELVTKYGGIRGGQSLYFLQEKEYYACAMLWPWQDEEHITLKIFYS
jgi:hypothetical protein